MKEGNRSTKYSRVARVRGQLAQGARAGLPPRQVRRGVALALALGATSFGCAKRKEADVPTSLPPRVELAVNEQAVFTSSALEDYRIDGGGIVSVAASPQWLVLGGLRPGQTRLNLKRVGGSTLSATVVVSDGPPRRGVEITLAEGETRVLDVPEALSYEARGQGVFRATLENPRAVGVLAVAPGVGTLAVLGKGDAFALYRIVVKPRPE
jgi:hypothetical protein